MNQTFTNIPSLLTKTNHLPTPFFVIDEDKIENNLKVLQSVIKATDCKILLAQKAFSCFDFYPIISKYLSGTTASGLYEAQLAHEYFATNNKKVETAKNLPDYTDNTKATGCENHVFAPAFTDSDIQKIVKICSHIVFNSANQLNKHYDICKKNNVSISLRVNPQHSTQGGGETGNHSLYDPCAPLSRFGVKIDDTIWKDESLHEKLDGLHFHTLCQQGYSDLESTFKVFESSFGEFFSKLCKHKNNIGKTPYINLGGGHHITNGKLHEKKRGYQTDNGYNIERLIGLIEYIKQKYGCQVYLEPGEAVVLNSGYLVSSVLDIIDDKIMPTVILDTSAACHNPDILETKHDYMPPIYKASIALTSDLSSPNTCRLAGNSCLTGDIIGDYKFDKKLQISDKVVFGDMALYTIVKGNTFNGIPLPDIYKLSNNSITQIRKSDYIDFKSRLGK